MYSNDQLLNNMISTLPLVLQMAPAVSPESVEMTQDKLSKDLVKRFFAPSLKIPL